MKIRVTVLGCGGSKGVPLIGLGWGICDPNQPRNRRRRTSILIEAESRRILVDSGPDMREQLLDADVDHLDAVIYTHAHADHTAGLDDLMAFYWKEQRRLPIYATDETHEVLQRRYPHAISQSGYKSDYYKPFLDPYPIDPAHQPEVEICGLPFRFFEQDHGSCKTLGLRLGDFGYSTDAKTLDETAFAALKGIRAWIVGAVRMTKAHPTHANLPEALDWIAHVRPERAWLTHLGHHMDYDHLSQILPQGIAPAHDGLVINL